MSKLSFYLKLVLASQLLSCSDYKNQAVPINPTNLVGGATQNKSLPVHLLTPNDGEFSIERMLANIGLNVISKNAEELLYSSGTFKNTLTRYCNDLKNDPATASDANVKNLWKQTMLSYHRFASLPMGLLSENNGQIKRQIYSWPVVSPCAIDQEVIKLNTSDLSNTLQNRKSLSALEYLLFEDSLNSTCNAFVEPKVNEWNGKTELEKKQDRCAYAMNVAEDVHKNIKQISTYWDKDAGNATVLLVDGSKYENENKAVNAYSDGLFAFELFRDENLAIPMGIHNECKNPSGKCIENVEHTWSKIAYEAIEAKIIGFRQGFFGSLNKNQKAFGLDDYLISKGYSEIVADIDTSTTDSLNTLNALKNSGRNLPDLITDLDLSACKNALQTNTLSSESLCRLYQEIRNGTSTLKIDVLTVLALAAPATHAGDND